MEWWEQLWQEGLWCDTSARRQEVELREWRHVNDCFPALSIIFFLLSAVSCLVVYHYILSHVLKRTPVSLLFVLCVNKVLLNDIPSSVELFVYKDHCESLQNTLSTLYRLVVISQYLIDVMFPLMLLLLLLLFTLCLCVTDT